MIKLSEVIYNKIIAQTEEAELLGFHDLANDLSHAVKGANIVTDDDYSYSRKELDSDIRKNIWKSALAVIGYHNMSSVDLGKLSEIIDEVSDKVSNAIETSLNVENNIGPKDKIPGVE